MWPVFCCEKTRYIDVILNITLQSGILIKLVFKLVVIIRGVPAKKVNCQLDKKLAADYQGVAHSNEPKRYSQHSETIQT
ncbi:hypothetical protein J1TS3_31570 [Siminovitchia fordii]|uniref:Uncharacterized protein n=1 Tax=Siminovitchia fordii TaxID=254759 RepID=A0ABQ4KA62_9BACI|nr:hypothetical protein J1TS3_31570 [Siminovitchia fordii]